MLEIFAWITIVSTNFNSLNCGLEYPLLGVRMFLRLINKNLLKIVQMTSLKMFLQSDILIRFIQHIIFNFLKFMSSFGWITCEIYISLGKNCARDHDLFKLSGLSAYLSTSSTMKFCFTLSGGDLQISVPSILKHITAAPNLNYLPKLYLKLMARTSTNIKCFLDHNFIMRIL